MSKHTTRLVLLLLTAGRLFAGDISGHVVDSHTGESIIGVNVFVRETGRGCASDLEGFFVLRDLDPGVHELTFSHIAYRDSSLMFQLGPVNEYIGRIPLAAHTIQSQAVEITATRSSIIQKDLDIASFQVDPVVLGEIPQLNKDVFKLVQYSPSVTVSDAFSPQYYVRGSDPGENLVQLDGMTIYNPQHFMGSNAIFNPYAIKNIEMLVGGFDAEYGGRNASILNITTREGHQSEAHGEFRPSISGLQGAVEFPLGGGTAMLSGRALTDIMTRVFMGSPNLMMDFNAALRMRLGKTNLRCSGFYARDYMDYTVDPLFVFFPDSIFDHFEEAFTTNTRNRALGIQTSTMLRPTLLLETHAYHSASFTDNTTRFAYAANDPDENLDIEMDFRTRIENAVTDHTLKARLTWYAFGGQTFKIGGEWNQLGFFNELGRFSGKPDPTEEYSDFQALYFQDRVEFGPLTVKLGLRQSRNLVDGRWRPEPRGSASLRLGTTTLKAAYGRYYQYLTTMDSKGDEFVQFLDYYNSLGDRTPINSTHHILGLEGRLTSTIDYSISGYYKVLNRLYRSTYSGSQGLLQAETEIEAGEGEAYGFEVLVRGDLGPLSGWVGYNWSRGLRRYPSILNGKKTLFDGDQPHNLKAILMYKLTPDITASTTIQYTSGFPRTWEIGQLLRYAYDPLTNELGAFATTITPERNNVRYPPRLTWDVGWKKTLRGGFGYHLAEYLGGVEASYQMTIRNIMFLHRDPYYYFYLPEYGYYGFDFEFLPAITAGYSIRF